MPFHRKWSVIVVAVSILLTGSVIGSTTALAAATGGMGTDLFVSLPTGATHTVQLWTWSGQSAGQLTTAPVAECCSTVSASPNGRRLAISGHRGVEIVNDRGKPLGVVSAMGTWADDNRHLCSIQAKPPAPGRISSSGSLLLEQAGQRARLVKKGLGGYGPHFQTEVAWCSIRHDRSVIFSNFEGRNMGVEVVQISTGKVLHLAWEKTQVLSWVAVSGNGRYVVAIASGGGGEVIDTETGKIVGTVPFQPVGVSWNGHVVVGTSVSTAQAIAVNWVSGRTVWVSNPPISQCPCPLPAIALAAKPGSDALAAVITNTHALTPPTAALWLFGPAFPPKLLSDRVQEGVV